MPCTNVTFCSAPEIHFKNGARMECCPRFCHAHLLLLLAELLPRVFFLALRVVYGGLCLLHLLLCLQNACINRVVVYVSVFLAFSKPALPGFAVIHISSLGPAKYVLITLQARGEVADAVMSNPGNPTLHSLQLNQGPAHEEPTKKKTKKRHPVNLLSYHAHGK